MRTQLVGVVIALVLLGAGCSGGSSSTVVDGFEIATADVEALHANFEDLDDDERAGSLLLLILRQAFGAAAAGELGLELEGDAVNEAERERLEGFESRGGADVVLEATNQTLERVRVEAELDVIRASVEETLVRREAPGFDLDRAYEAYLMVEAEVCIRLIAVDSQSGFDDALERLNAGEDFADVARELSIDPFAQRVDGSGAGGDFGCSAPDSLVTEFGSEVLDVPLNVPSGPVLSGPALYLFEVYERTAPDLADVRDEVIEFAVEDQGPDLFRQWAIEVLQGIDVEVASEFGEWGMLPETDPVPTVVPGYRTDAIIDS